MRTAALALALGAPLAFTAPVAHANGRYPSARNLVVGPGSSANVLALQTTFGVVISANGGRTWRWICEDALGFTGTWDPTLAIARDGTLVVALPDSLSIGSAPYCTFNRPASAPGVQVVDLTTDPGSDHVAAAIAPFDSSPNGLALSDDGGRSWRAGWSLRDFFIETVDYAPGMPRRMYASGFMRGAVPVLFRSDDGGTTFTETTRNFFGGYNAWIAGVDATRPDVLYVRSDLSTGPTMLLRSDDGGRTFREVVRTDSAMTGAAFAPDGRTLWVAGAGGRDGVLRSSDGGMTWRQVNNTFTPLCLRYQAGILFACADEQTDGFALACSTDGGEHFIPLLAFEDIRGPEDCPTGSGTRDRCEPLWPMVRAMLTSDAGVARPPRGTHPDASAPFDAGAAPDGGDADLGETGTSRDATVAPDAGRTDAGLDASLDARDAEPTSLGGQGACSCRVVGATRPSPSPATLAALLAALTWLGVRRRPC